MTSFPTPPRITLIHATPLSLPPVHSAFAELWPEADAIDLLDTSLSTDRDRGVPVENFEQRLKALAEHAMNSGAQGILFTCSAFGRAIDRIVPHIPVPALKPNAPMFQAALAQGNNILMLATHAPPVTDLVDEFSAMAKGHARLTPILNVEARAALLAGDGIRHDQLLAEAALRAGSYDAILLAHFSTARAATAIGAALGSNVPVLTAPGAAVMALKEAVASAAGE